MKITLTGRQKLKVYICQNEIEVNFKPWHWTERTRNYIKQIFVYYFFVLWKIIDKSILRTEINRKNRVKSGELVSKDFVSDKSKNFRNCYFQSLNKNKKTVFPRFYYIYNNLDIGNLQSVNCNFNNTLSMWFVLLFRVCV